MPSAVYVVKLNPVVRLNMACSVTNRTHSINLERNGKCADHSTLMCKLVYNFNVMSYNIWNFLSAPTKNQGSPGH